MGQTAVLVSDQVRESYVVQPRWQKRRDKGETAQQLRCAWIRSENAKMFSKGAEPDHHLQQVSCFLFAKHPSCEALFCIYFRCFTGLSSQRL